MHCIALLESLAFCIVLFRACVVILFQICVFKSHSITKTSLSRFLKSSVSAPYEPDCDSSTAAYDKNHFPTKI